MIDYSVLLDALKNGAVERHTSSISGMTSIWHDGKLLSGEDSSYDVSETITAEPVFVMFGAGHVGKALHSIAALCGIRTIILDDRTELATEERFPGAECHTASFPELLSKEYHPFPCYIIFTHGHSYDLECLRYALDHNAMYIGMIGSKRKVEAQFSILRQEGFSDEVLKHVHAPIGLSINAVTPEEIAVSIMAEIISEIRKDRKAVQINTELLDIMSRNEGIEVRIISKDGSSPQEVGATMFVTEKRTYSTIGGGALEKIAEDKARKMLSSGESLYVADYDLREGGNTAMICGGVLKVLFSAVRPRSDQAL